MSETPENCAYCPNRTSGNLRIKGPKHLPDCPHGDGITYSDVYGTFNPKKTQYPGPSCPFVRLDQANAEIAQVRDHEKRILADSNKLLEKTREQQTEIERLRAKLEEESVAGFVKRSFDEKGDNHA